MRNSHIYSASLSSTHHMVFWRGVGCSTVTPSLKFSAEQARGALRSRPAHANNDHPSWRQPTMTSRFGHLFGEKWMVKFKQNLADKLAKVVLFKAHKHKARAAIRREQIEARGSKIEHLSRWAKHLSNVNLSPKYGLYNIGSHHHHHHCHCHCCCLRWFCVSCLKYGR